MSNENMRYRHHTDMVNYQASVRIDKARDYAQDARRYAERVEEIAKQIEEHSAEFVDKTFVYEQGIAANEWIVSHNLNKYPSVTVYDSSGNEVICDVQYINENSCKIVANAPFKGRACIN